MSIEETLFGYIGYERNSGYQISSEVTDPLHDDNLVNISPMAIACLSQVVCLWELVPKIS